MVESLQIRTTATYRRWRSKLKDREAIRRIAARLARLQHGHAGDVAPVGGGVSELRIHDGPGYRIYFIRRGQTLIVLLCGGDKNSQADDIRVARSLAEDPEVADDS